MTSLSTRSCNGSVADAVDMEDDRMCWICESARPGPVLLTATNASQKPALALTSRVKSLSLVQPIKVLPTSLKNKKSKVICAPINSVLIRLVYHVSKRLINLFDMSYKMARSRSTCQSCMKPPRKLFHSEPSDTCTEAICKLLADFVEL